MRIGIIQVDGKLPNLALMKITNYHLLQGHEVENYKGGLWHDTYNKIYISKIFSFSNIPQIPDYNNVVIGGTGIDFINKLPPEIEKTNPSYLLYPDCNYHLGFSQKGCRFNCPFCCVPKKEGKPYLYNDIDEILINPNGKNKLMLLDNDFFGGMNWKENLKRIIELKLKVCFVQGLNIRIITKKQAELLSQVNYANSKFKQKYLTFAWDRFNDERLIDKGIKICNDSGIPSTNMQFFILIGFDTTHEQNHYRVMKLKELGSKPFVMPYNKADKYQKAFARWVNHRAVFNACNWQEYCEKNNYKFAA